MGVCLGEDGVSGLHAGVEPIIGFAVDPAGVPLLGEVLAQDSAPPALVLSPFTLCGGEGGGDFLDGLAFKPGTAAAMRAQPSRSNFTGGRHVLLGDGH